VAAVAAGAARAESLEGLQQAVDLGRRDGLPGVGHRQDGATAAGPGGDLDVPAGDVVPDGVVDQVGYQLLDQEGVAVEDGGLDGGADIQAEAADPRAGDGQAALVMAARSRGSCWLRPASLLARVSSASTRRSVSALKASRSRLTSCQVAVVLAGSAR